MKDRRWTPEMLHTIEDRPPVEPVEPRVGTAVRRFSICQKCGQHLLLHDIVKGQNRPVCPPDGTGAASPPQGQS